jgi:sugar phosphate isomerase/epimerase
MNATASESPTAPTTPTTWAVFTKPWRTQTPADLSRLVARMGFNAVEFPLRPGYQVDLESLETSLGSLVTTLGDEGIRIASVAGSPDRRVVAACAAHGIDLLRIMVPIGPDGFVATRNAVRRELDALVPIASEYGVRIGIQPHHDFYIADSSELAVLIEDYDPRVVVAIWDAAHDGLACKRPVNALELLWDRLAMVNFKNAYQEPTVQGTDGAMRWGITFVGGAEGLCSWPEAAAYLRDRGYRGPVCLPAEYTDETNLEAKVSADLAYLKKLIGARDAKSEESV